jgi:hypothetical protein
VTRRLVIAATALTAAVLAGGSAWAWWSGAGSAAGSSATGSVLRLTTSASVPAGATLVPGTSAPLVLAVTNPNTRPVLVTGVQLDASRPVTVTGGAGACVDPPVTVFAVTSTTLAADSTTTITVPAAVTLGTTAPSGCQGATFVVPVSLSGRVS